MVKPFTQLYIFHGLLNNGVSYPLLYCLVKGKTQSIYDRLLQLVERIARGRNATIFNRPVRLMVDFEKSFHNAILKYQSGNFLSCCFFHFVSNIKKRCKQVIEALKSSLGKDSAEVELAEATKRALMMLPLLPLDLISVDTVDFILWRWRMTFQNRQSTFDGVRDYLVRNYVGTNALFKKKIWCMCGYVTRTNNAAESSHAVLNSHVRVSGAVPLDMFLFSIESQMRNTRREIEQGCRPHTKAIYRRRNELLAAELSDLLNSRRGVLWFLDHCASVMNIENENDVTMFFRRKMSDEEFQFDHDWALRNRGRVVGATLSLQSLYARQLF